MLGDRSDFLLIGINGEVPQKKLRNVMVITRRVFRHLMPHELMGFAEGSTKGESPSRSWGLERARSGQVEPSLRYSLP
jgi:hypothetical protein